MPRTLKQQKAIIKRRDIHGPGPRPNVAKVALAELLVSGWTGADKKDHPPIVEKCLIQLEKAVGDTDQHGCATSASVRAIELVFGYVWGPPPKEIKHTGKLEIVYANAQQPSWADRAQAAARRSDSGPVANP